MTNLNQTAVAEFLELKKDRLEKLRNFIEISIEMAVDLKDDSEYKTMVSIADKARKESTIVYEEIEFVESVDNAIRTKQAEGFMAQFVELSNEDVAKASKMIVEFLEQTV